MDFLLLQLLKLAGLGTRLGARRWARITLVVLIIGVAVVGVSTGRGVWKWAYWYRVTEVETIRLGSPLSPATRKYYKLRHKRWSWLPGQDFLRTEITEDQYESMLEEQIRRARCGN